MSHYEIDFLPEYTDEALLDELRRVAALLPAGEPLTKAVCKRHGLKVSESTICKRFGGWKEALERAGLGHLYVGQPVSQKMKEQPARDLSKEDLIAELKRVHALVRKSYLTTRDFNQHSITSAEAIRSRFGTFHHALDIAGIPESPHKPRRFTDTQCFESLATVWTHFGRAPRYRQMFEPPSTIQAKTYVERWGTWRKTLMAFAEWADSEAELGQTGPEGDQPTAEPKAASQKPRAEAECREIRPGLRFRVFLRDRFRCVACGRSPATHLNVELHADHRQAVANGGKTTLENLQTLCQDCNLGKGRKTVS
jgi:hypothetical protein